MDAKTLEALQGSIAKWESIVSGKGKDDGGDNCPLCQLFNNDDVDPDSDRICVGCPVAEKTDSVGCADTPYEKWAALTWLNRPRFPRAAQNAEQITAAQAELDFLRSLLPAEAA